MDTNLLYNKGRRESFVLTNKRVKEMISNLKGRISKALTFAKKLSEDERLVLGGIYNSIDEIILWDRKFTKSRTSIFKKSLAKYANLIEDSDKSYIKKHITPILKKVVEQEWEVI